MNTLDKFETLHCHTKLSDGLMTHEEVLDECAHNNIGIVAFTDHDILPSPELIKELKEKNHPTKFITGIEMSANYVAETEEDVANFHIIGLFVDPTNEALREYCKEAGKKRVERGTRMIENIQKLGFDITLDDIKQVDSEGTLGRPHIARAILAKEENMAILDKLMDDLKKSAELEPVLAKKFQRIKNHDNFSKIFDLFLANESFLKGVYVPYLHRTSMDEAVELIRGAGGVAILAHWSFYKNKINPELIKKIAREKRVDGFETVYEIRGGGGKIPLDVQRDMLFLKDVVDEYGLVRGGGGDFHTVDEFSVMVDFDTAQYAVQTTGLVKNILAKHPKTDLSWSTVTR